MPTNQMPMPQSQPQEQPQGSNALPAMLGEVAKSLFNITAMFKDAGAPPELLAEMTDITNKYNAVIEKIGGKTSAPEGPENIPVPSNRPEEAANVRPVIGE